MQHTIRITNCQHLQPCTSHNMPLVLLLLLLLPWICEPASAASAGASAVHYCTASVRCPQQSAAVRGVLWQGVAEGDAGDGAAGGADLEGGLVAAIKQVPYV
jgi:hypothetical protein